jgi:long-chain acyl-CoA synthetase
MNPRLNASEMADLVGVLGGCALGIAGADAAPRLATTTDVVGLDELRGGDPAPLVPGGDDESVILFTSGTSGLPKAVPHTHAAFIARIKAFAQPAVAEHQMRLLCVPIFHVGGLLGQCVSLYAGHTTVVQRRFDAGEWLRLVEEHRVQVTFCVPTMVARVLEHPDFATTDLSSLQSITYGAAPMPPSVLDRAVTALPHVAFTNTFGQTETLGGIAFLSAEDHHHPVRRTSVGKLSPSVVSKIVDGELWIGRPDGSWLHTGDLVTQDADGYLYVTGRLTDTINRGGEKFGPIEVETVLREHPSVRDAAVAALAHADLGEVAGVVGWCRERLSSYKVPARVVFAEVPYTDFGKVDRRATAALLALADATTEGN